MDEGKQSGLLSRVLRKMGNVKLVKSQGSIGVVQVEDMTESLCSWTPNSEDWQLYRNHYSELEKYIKGTPTGPVSSRTPSDLPEGNEYDHRQGGLDACANLDNLYLQILETHLGTNEALIEDYRGVMGAIVTLQAPLSTNGLVSLCGRALMGQAKVDRVCMRMRPFLSGYTFSLPHQPVQILHESIRYYLTQRAPLQYRLHPLPEQHEKLSNLILAAIQDQVNSKKIPELGYSGGDWDIFDVPAIPHLEESVSEHLRYSCMFLVDHLLAIIPAGTIQMALIQRAHQIILSHPRSILELSASLGRGSDLLPLISLALNNLPSSADHGIPWLRPLPPILRRIATCLLEDARPKEALPLLREAVDISRRILDVEQPTPEAEQELIISSRELTYCLNFLKQYVEGRLALEDLVAPTRRLAIADPERFAGVLGRVLRSLSLPISMTGGSPAALLLSKEAVEIHRRLAQQNEPRYVGDLSASLFALADDYSDLKMYNEAKETTRDAIEKCRRCNTLNPKSSTCQARTAATLRFLGSMESKLGNTEAAIEAMNESVAILRRLTGVVDSRKYHESLAKSYEKLASHYSSDEKYHEAIENVKRSILIRRMLVERDPQQFKAKLAKSLDDHCYSLGRLRQHREAVDVGEEAVVIRRDLNTEDPTTQNKADLSWSLLHLARQKHHLDCYNIDSLKFSQEAVALRRQLTLVEDTKYEGRLISSLVTHIACLRKLDRFCETNAAFEEAITVSRRVVSRTWPETSNQLQLVDLLSDYGSVLASIDRLDESIWVYEEVVNILRSLGASSPESTHSYSRELLSGLDSLSKLLDRGSRIQEAVQVVREAIDVRRQLGVASSRSKHTLGELLRNYAWFRAKTGEYAEASGPDMIEAIQLLRSAWSAQDEVQPALLFHHLCKRRLDSG
ncbi:hypothetical protein FA15DRAFT_670209 [Coprinopsis marcescibilis]|uniref:TPR-like protein n=1 Tax=Coprinopsis marcescibilis TaxID=230819 RepID=A0A5C3KT36_COPMA|nr:hypothetical protein FA15DRAFT_670209 [Coprinopsis marcescibilis]